MNIRRSTVLVLIFAAFFIMSCIIPDLFYVTYDANGGENAPTDSLSYETGDTAAVKDDSTMTKDGRTDLFIEWNTKSDGTGTSYSSGDTLIISSSDVTLYAQWEPTFKVIYNANGGEDSPTDSAYYTTGETAIVKDGIAFFFIEWNTKSDGTGTSHAPAATITIADADITLYAQWETDVIGKTGPAGGLVFYDKGSYTDSWRYLEAAPQSTEWTSVEWSPAMGNTITGAEGIIVGTGKSNTADLVAQYPGSDYAANRCDALSVTYNGSTYSDWFLPSYDEMAEIYNNLYLNSLGDFTITDYWTSTKYLYEDGYFKKFTDGSFYTSEGDSLYARAVRAF